MIRKIKPLVSTITSCKACMYNENLVCVIDKHEIINESTVFDCNLLSSYLRKEYDELKAIGVV